MNLFRNDLFQIGRLKSSFCGSKNDLKRQIKLEYCTDVIELLFPKMEKGVLGQRKYQYRVSRDQHPPGWSLLLSRWLFSIYSSGYGRSGYCRLTDHRWTVHPKFSDILYHIVTKENEKLSGQNMSTGCPQPMDYMIFFPLFRVLL